VAAAAAAAAAAPAAAASCCELSNEPNYATTLTSSLSITN
jgi:hypothetical protein